MKADYWGFPTSKVNQGWTRPHPHIKRTLAFRCFVGWTKVTTFGIFLRVLQSSSCLYETRDSCWRKFRGHSPPCSKNRKMTSLSVFHCHAYVSRAEIKMPGSWSHLKEMHYYSQIARSMKKGIYFEIMWNGLSIFSHHILFMLNWHHFTIKCFV